MADDGLYTPSARLVRLETRVFGIEGRGGIVDEFEHLQEELDALDREMQAQIDRLRAAINRAALAFASFALALAGAIITHTI